MRDSGKKCYIDMYGRPIDIPSGKNYFDYAYGMT